MLDNSEIIYTFKRSYSISYNNNLFCCVGGSINLYSIKSGMLEATIKDTKQPLFSQFTTDNRLIVKAPTGYFVYDLQSYRQIKKLTLPNCEKSSTTSFVLSPDNKFIIDFVYIFPFQQLMIMEIETGEHALYHLFRARTPRVFYSNNNSAFYIVTTDDNYDLNLNERFAASFYSVKYPFVKPEINRLSFCLGKYSQIDYHGNKFASAGFDGIITVYDVSKYETQLIEYEKKGVLYCIRWSNSGRFLAVAETNAIQIIDTVSCKTIRSIDIKYGCYAAFYDNDTKLLIGTWEKGYCIDISQTTF